MTQTGATQTYDVAVLGGGPGGYVAALRAAQRGARVALIELGPLGGACLNVGCIPSKAMLHASELAWQMAHAAPLGLAAAAPSVDGPAFMARVAGVVATMRKGVEGLLKARKVEVIRGRGRLAGPDALAVETAGGPLRVQAKSIILATGSRPGRPAFLPWDSGTVMTTDEATTAADLPASLLIVGGGIIGCECATMYAELGIPVTLVEMLDRLASQLDDDAGKAIARSLEKRGVKVLTGAKLTAVRADEGGVTAELADGTALKAAKALVAVGRPANVEGLGLETAGIELADGLVPVDDHCRTKAPNIYAVGDVAERMQYAHLASRMGVVAADNATGHDARDDRAVVPAGVYTHPEVATVGLSEAHARARHPSVRVARFPYLASGMARAYGEMEGMVKLLGEPDSGRILGAVVIGPHATDVIMEVALAMRHGLGVAAIAETIHAHPTFSEAVHEAAEAWLGLPTHILR